MFKGMVTAASLMSAMIVAAPAAMAADVLDVETAPVASFYDWSGLYAGLQVGGGKSSVDWTYDSNGQMADHDGSGAFGGAQIGYNFQAGNLVFGAEADIAGGKIDGSTDCPNVAFSCESKVKTLGSVRARAGYAFDRILAYGTGGFGFGNVEIQTDNSILGTNGESDTQTGWSAGAGIEFGITKHLTLKGEYMHYDLGDSTYVVDTDLDVNADVDVDTGKVGINYKF